MSEVAQQIQWKVVREFKRHGKIWSPGAPPPDLPVQEIERLSRDGFLAPRSGDNPFPRQQPGSPRTAAEYLRAKDALVLINIRRFRPTKTIVAAILAQAEQENRSVVFLEALRLHLDLPVVE